MELAGSAFHSLLGCGLIKKKFEARLQDCKGTELLFNEPPIKYNQILVAQW